MSLNQEEMFQKLLEQVGLQHEERYKPYFTQAKVLKVTVHKLSKCWNFHLQFQDVLPFEVYQNLSEKMQLAFHTIARVQLTIETVKPVMTIEKLEHYWSTAVKLSAVSSPICDKPFREQFPLLNGKKIQFYVENEVVKGHLMNQYLPPVEEAYGSLGFPKFKIEPVIDEASHLKKIAEFQAKKRRI